MYADLQKNAEQLLKNPLVRTLGLSAHVESGVDLDFDPVPEDRLDEAAPPETTPLIIDADSSQRQCVQAAVAGKSFVMQGPPGTGKTQTIANIIAALMNIGKRVLFVSEKAAALDVAYDRLASVGLGHYVGSQPPDHTQGGRPGARQSPGLPPETTGRPERRCTGSACGNSVPSSRPTQRR